MIKSGDRQGFIVSSLALMVVVGIGDCVVINNYVGGIPYSDARRIIDVVDQVVLEQQVIGDPGTDTDLVTVLDGQGADFDVG